MDLHTYEILYRIEETHWWHSARRLMVLDWIKQRYRDRDDLRILDAGCGTGLMLQQLKPFGAAEGVDLADEALDFCRMRGLDNVRRADLLNLPYEAGTFDVITALDVLEHLDDDAGALREMGRVLKPGGRVFIFAPAHRWLWSLQDEISHHKRRYTASTLRAAVAASGLALERQTYVSTFLLPVIYLGRKWLKVRLKLRGGTIPALESENDLHPDWSNGILRSVFESEIPLLRRTDMPFGASLICVARKPA